VAGAAPSAYHGGVRRLAPLMTVVLLCGCGGPETTPEPPAPEPIAAGPTRDVPELGRPRPKLLPPEATAGAARE
jgi:hypothetical protein